jgi:hypothetical protein
VTSSSMVGRSEPGCDPGSALSFKDVHHPGWGGGRAEPELYPPRGSAGHLSSSFWWWKPSSGSAEEASSSHAREGELLLPS